MNARDPLSASKPRWMLTPSTPPGKIALAIAYCEALEEGLEGWPQDLVWGFNRGLLVAVGLTVLAAIPLALGGIVLALAYTSGDLPAGVPCLPTREPSPGRYRCTSSSALWAGC
jgi:hypothetical protein